MFVAAADSGLTTIGKPAAGSEASYFVIDLGGSIKLNLAAAGALDAAGEIPIKIESSGRATGTITYHQYASAEYQTPVVRTFSFDVKMVTEDPKVSG